MTRTKKRKHIFIQPKWCICTEGETEALYLKAYCEELGIKHLIDINTDNKNCTKPKSQACGRQHRPLIEQIQMCRRDTKYIRMIAVHDFDEDGPKKAISFDEASEIGRQTDISVYYSIPCIEYWLLLHLNPLDAYLTGDLCRERVKKYVNESRAKKGLRALHKDYYKTDPALFFYFGGISGARKAAANAKRL